ncbi:hypothetical protein [Streptomyces mirabilis]|nr:hypothetical protein [Streptomyces mirabilis]
MSTAYAHWRPSPSARYAVLGTVVFLRTEEEDDPKGRQRDQSP